jgi:cytolysin-activating lysine-acyltransferase
MAKTTRKKAATKVADKPELPKEAASITQSVDGISDHHLLAGAALLLLESPAHRHYFLGDFDWLVKPPIALKQCKIFFEAGRPIAFASWALLSDEAEERFIKSYKLAPRDWQSGAHLWLIDLVCSKIQTEQVLAYLRSAVFAGRQYKYLSATQQGLIVKVEQ